jgi:hypothetical protein
MKLPEREKPYSHYHFTKFASKRLNPHHFPILSAEDEKKVFKMIKEKDSYGKVILTWNPNDKLRPFPPHVSIVHPTS